MKIGILSFRPLHRRVSYEERRLKEEVLALGYRVRVYRIDRFLLFFDHDRAWIYYNGKPFRGCNVIITRPSVLDNVDLNVFIIKQFELMGMPVVNNYISIVRAKNKLRTAQILRHHNIPIPATAVLRRLEDFDMAIKKVKGIPLIMKKVSGSLGKGVMIVESKRAANSTLDAFWNDEGSNLLLFQEYVKESKGEDTRVIVVGNKMLGGIVRKAKKGEFRSNLHLGGTGRKAEVTPEMTELSIKAAHALGLEIAGVDLLNTSRGPVVMEVNSNPGFEGFEQCTGINVAKEIVRYALSLAKK